MLRSFLIIRFFLLRLFFTYYFDLTQMFQLQTHCALNHAGSRDDKIKLNRSDEKCPSILTPHLSRFQDFFRGHDKMLC